MSIHQPGDWLNKLWYILTKEHYISNKKDETELPVFVSKCFQNTQFTEKSMVQSSVYKCRLPFVVLKKRWKVT